ncbi:MAG: filamentous hemagglutinin N-terminal domain-containing protein [Rhodoferax sp.]|nr:filamentous hemagglutinin N-terminal domain-containing protein [Rhodoferax sp.]
MSSRASLNHIFRTVWNQALGAMVAVAETDSSSSGGSGRRVRAAALQRPPEVGLGLLALSIAIAWSALPSVAIANPTGGVAVVGQASFTNSGNKLLVTTQNGASGNYSAINWQSFSIPTGSSTHFQQPNATSTSINRVVTNTPTQIFGTLSSNGNLVLVNHAGIAVGAGAVVDTNGFTASSLAMSDADAMAGRLRFGDGTISTSGVSVNGSILARSGDVVLLGANVNTGVDALVQAPNGSAILAAGQQVDITGRGLEGIRLQVQAPSDSAVNLGTLKGDAVGMFAGTLKHSGFIQATAASLEGGRVVLKAGDLSEVAGTVLAQGQGEVGGAIHVTGSKVLLKGSALLDATGHNGGGEVLVGGGWHGEDARISNAQFTLIGSGAQLKADATGSGNGGQVVVWSDGATRFAGSVSARGGSLGGNGGSAEVSGKQYLDFQGSADLRAPLGHSGNLLLDPLNLTISAGPADINGDSSTGDDLAGLTLLAGVSPGANSVITAAAVVTQLGLGDVVLEATNNINVNSAISYVGGTPRLLTLNGGNQINLNAAISTSSAALDVDMTAGAGGIVASSGTITTGGGAVHLISAGNMALDAINVGAGNISLNASSGSSVTQSAGFTASGIELKGSGSYTLTSTGNVITKIGTSSGGASDGAISFTAQGGLAVDTVASVGITRTGSVTLSSFGGAITQTQPIVATALGTSAYSGVTLTNSGNSVGSFASSVGMTGGVSFTNSGALSLGAISTATGGNLQITTGGALTQSAALSVNASGASTFNAGSSAITLTNSGNNFGSAVSLNTTGNASVSNTSGIVLGTSNVGGSLAVVTNGSITQTGAITASTLDITLSAGAFASLTNSGNLVSTLKVAKTSTEQVSYFNNGSLALGPITTGGNLSIFTATGTNISQSGSATVGGFATLSAGDSSGYGSLVLTNAANNFASVNLKGSQVSIKDSNALVVSGLFADSGATLIEAGGNLTLSGGLYSYGSGDAIKFVSGGTFSGSGGFISLGTAGARWLAYLGTPGSETFPSSVPPTFKQYNATNGSTVLGTGSGVLYSVAPSLGASLSGEVSKIYDGTTSIPTSGATLSGFTGALGVDNIANAVATPASAVLSDPNVGTGKSVTMMGTIGGVLSGYGDPVGLGKPVYGYQFTASGNIGTVTTAVATVSLSGTRVYNGLTSLDASIFSLTGVAPGDTLSLVGQGSMDDKNVGTNKPVSLGTLAFGPSGPVSNYTLVGGTYSVTITPLALTSISGITANDKVYDGKTGATLNTSNAVLNGAIPGDSLSLVTTNAIGTFADRNVGVAKQVTVTGLSVTGADISNYSIPASLSTLTATGTITVRPLSVWAGGSSGAWSSPSNWDALPDGNNVLAVSVPAGVAVTFDKSVGALKLDSLTAGSLVMSGGSLTVGSAMNVVDFTQSDGTLGITGSLSVSSNYSQSGGTLGITGGLSVGSNYAQTGGSVTVAGPVSAAQFSQSAGSLTGSSTLNVTSGFQQTGGTVAMGGAVTATQTSGNLMVGSVTAPTVSLTASSGSIGQDEDGPLVVSGLLSTQSTTGTTLNNAGNKVGSFQGTNTGTGSIAFTSVGAMNVVGANTTNGDITIINFGGITTTGAVTANGSLSMTANSPLVIGPAGVSATGNISLVTTNLTSPGNLTLNGNVSSSAGSVAIAAAGNYVQNSTVKAAQGITASAGGSMTFGPDAITSGNPVNFEAGGTVVVPPGVVTQGSTPTDFVATFMSNFEDALIAQNSSTGDPNDKDKEKDVVVEGQSCTR